MKAVILGCGRVGSTLASILAEKKWEVTVIDADNNAFSSLGENFSGQQINGNIADEEVLRSGNIETADFIAILTSDDIANLMAAQIAGQKFGKEMVLVRVRDPIKSGAYKELGLRTICPTEVELDMILKVLGITAKKSKGG